MCSKHRLRSGVSSYCGRERQNNFKLNITRKSKYQLFFVLRNQHWTYPIVLLRLIASKYTITRLDRRRPKKTDSEKIPVPAPSRNTRRPIVYCDKYRSHIAVLYEIFNKKYYLLCSLCCSECLNMSVYYTNKEKHDVHELIKGSFQSC